MDRGLTLFTARWVVLDAGQVVENAGLLVRAGRVAGVCRAPRRVEARSRVHLGEAALTPGLVNAHAHLELTDLAGRLPRGTGFVGWLRALVDARRRESGEDLRAAVRSGADRLLASGCTTVGDIDTTGAALGVLARHPLRAVVYRELLDLGDPARCRAALAVAGRMPAPRRRLVPGISPHAPYTASSELLAGVARLTARSGLPVALHWAETVEEGAWLEDAQGPFAELFERSPRRAGLELVESAGLLGPRLTLVHGNDPRRDELKRIAAAGASVVHCPGSHAFFDRPPFPLGAYRAAGIPLSLGTDSLASNETLDLRREMAHMRRAFPDLDPPDIWRWATEGGARALGMAGRVGALHLGLQADLVAWSTSARRVEDLWDELTGSVPAALGVWIGGRLALDGTAPDGSAPHATGLERGAPRPRAG